MPCDRPPDPPLSAAERAAQSALWEEKADRLASARQILAEQADAIESAEQSTYRATVLAAISTMQPLVDRGDITSFWVHDELREAVGHARGGYTCIECERLPAQGRAWWLEYVGDIICDTCRTCWATGMRWCEKAEPTRSGRLWAPTEG